MDTTDQMLRNGAAGEGARPTDGAYQAPEHYVSAAAFDPYSIEKVSAER